MSGTAEKGTVAPCTGAWIETIQGDALGDDVESPLAQGRGLKPFKSKASFCYVRSPLAQGRGLKQFNLFSVS